MRKREYIKELAQEIESLRDQIIQLKAKNADFLSENQDLSRKLEETKRILAETEVADGLVDICLGMQSCVDPVDILKYANGKMVYSWHISDLIIYDKPKELGEFKRCDKCPYGPLEKCWNHEYGCDGEYNVRRAPQSWCYVEYVEVV